MSPEQLTRRTERARTEPLVIARTEDGFRVYSAANRSRVYRVTGVPEEPACTCPDFRENAEDPDWRCKHILAVAAHLEAEEGPEEEYEREERAALQTEAKADRFVNGGASQMLIKRSVSPDGRIDALSVEFSCPVDTENGEAEARATRLLRLQDEIARRFLGKRNGERVPQAAPPARQPDGNRPLPATILDVGGMNGRFGRRLFLRFQADGRTLRRYGSPKQLGQLVAWAGYPELAEELEEGLALDIPCRVVLEPSKDGRYLNVARVLPAGGSGR